MVFKYLIKWNIAMPSVYREMSVHKIRNEFDLNILKFEKKAKRITNKDIDVTSTKVEKYGTGSLDLFIYFNASKVLSARDINDLRKIPRTDRVVTVRRMKK